MIKTTNTTYVHCVSKNFPPLTCYNLDKHDSIATIFGRSDTEKVRNQKSDDALSSHLTYLVLQHYLAKEETQMTAHWCFVRTTQSNCRCALDKFSPEPCPRSLNLNAVITRFRSHTAAWIWVVSQKRLNESSSDWLNSRNALIHWKMQFSCIPFCQVVQKHKLFEVE